MYFFLLLHHYYLIQRQRSWLPLSYDVELSKLCRQFLTEISGGGVAESRIALEMFLREELVGCRVMRELAAAARNGAEGATATTRWVFQPELVPAALEVIQHRIIACFVIIIIIVLNILLQCCFVDVVVVFQYFLLLVFHHHPFSSDCFFHALFLILSLPLPDFFWLLLLLLAGFVSPFPCLQHLPCSRLSSHGANQDRIFLFLPDDLQGKVRLVHRKAFLLEELENVSVFRQFNPPPFDPPAVLCGVGLLPSEGDVAVTPLLDPLQCSLYIETLVGRVGRNIHDDDGRAPPHEELFDPEVLQVAAIGEVQDGGRTQQLVGVSEALVQSHEERRVQHRPEEDLVDLIQHEVHEVGRIAILCGFLQPLHRSRKEPRKKIQQVPHKRARHHHFLPQAERE